MDKKLLMMALLMTTGLATQAQERLTQYQVRNAITVRTPIMNDSINPKGEKHTAKALLQTPVMLDLANAPTQMLSADTAGLVTFAKADKDNLLYLLKTQLRAERFMKGKLKVTSPVRWELFINGESKMVKDAAEDSISKAATKEITLRLEPEMDYEIAIKLLSTPDDKTAPSLKCELVKDDKFKSEPFLREVKAIYTDLINRHISDLEQQLKVFDKNSVYLPTKKIGKNNPKAAEIEADNTARQEWNRTADMALLSGISEAKILEVKQTEIHEKASQSIKSKGWLPNLFRGIVAKAKDFLQNLIREKDMLPKPTLDIDMAEFRHMRNLMIKAQDKAAEIKHLQDEVLPKLKSQLAEVKGIFKGKDRKSLTEQIEQTEKKISEKLEKLPYVLKKDGYPDVQAFMRIFREMESVVEQYNRDLVEWEYQSRRKSAAANKEQRRPPEKQSVLKHLHEIQYRSETDKSHRKKSFDRDSQ